MQSLSWNINYTDPNYDFLGNSLIIHYQVKQMINQTKVMKIHYSSGIDTLLNNIEDIFTNLGLSASYDDLRTENQHQIFKKTKWNFSELAGNYGFTLIKK